MESIFHEKQEGYLCAQHCLNALLQGPYFNAVDLANFGHQMDEEERIRMAESGIDSEDYKLFLEVNQPSGNMDDSGYFSVQVISSALKVWGLELIPYNSTEPTALLAQNDPSGPQLISDTYLTMYLAQLLQEGYSIFIVIGTLPQCPAEDVLLKNPIVATKSSSNAESKSTSKGNRLGTKLEDEIMKTALAMGEVKVPQPSSSATRNVSSLLHKSELSTDGSRERIIPIRVEGREEKSDDEEEDENVQLARALQMSLQNDEDDMDKTLKLRLDLHTDDGIKTTHLANSANDVDEDDELRRALQLSLECVTAPSTPDPEDLRWRRLNHFGIYSRTSSSEAPAKLNT
ncbi:ataxin-3 isoform X3 [Monomorium pharaonis]|uniref:ataxin-3 isoform X3 n=1 Tax=Monomorium pharaonis TaxID=307658 RepID=UPI00102E1E89|nr:ataxin-3 isoform X3 [Monomorium pharaonis]